MEKANLSMNADGSLTLEAHKILGLPTEEEEIAARRREHEREADSTLPSLRNAIDSFNSLLAQISSRNCPRNLLGNHHRGGNLLEVAQTLLDPQDGQPSQP